MAIKLVNFAAPSGNCLLKLRYSLKTFLIKCTSIPNDWQLHCLEHFPTVPSQKQQFGFEKFFDAAGAYSYDTKVSFPGLTGWAWVQLV